MAFWKKKRKEKSEEWMRVHVYGIISMAWKPLEVIRQISLIESMLHHCSSKQQLPIGFFFILPKKLASIGWSFYIWFFSKNMIFLVRKNDYFIKSSYMYIVAQLLELLWWNLRRQGVLKMLYWELLKRAK